MIPLMMQHRRVHIQNEPSPEVYHGMCGVSGLLERMEVCGYTPVGYSEHLDGTTVLETYHYTRTYLGKIAKKGDSGRRWGKYTVKATGTFCDEDVNMQYTQIVKYGTEDN